MGSCSPTQREPEENARGVTKTARQHWHGIRTGACVFVCVMLMKRCGRAVGCRLARDAYGFCSSLSESDRCLFVYWPSSCS